MVTLDDGTTSVSEITSTTITNTNPTVDSIVIDPADNITPESTLTCSATASDPDGGTPLSLIGGNVMVSLWHLQPHYRYRLLVMQRWEILSHVLLQHSMNMVAKVLNDTSVTVGNSPQALTAFALWSPAIQTFHLPVS